MTEPKVTYALALRRSADAEEAFVNVTIDQEDEFGFIARKRGFYPVALASADKALKAVQEGKVRLVLGSVPDRNTNLYPVTKLPGTVEIPAEGAAANTEAAGTLQH